MGLFRTFTGLFGRSAQSRNSGGQSSGPLVYAHEPAAPVTADTAMQVSAVWACVRLISESIASLPLRFYKLGPDGRRELDRTHHLAQLFSAGKVNRYQTRQEFFETMSLNLVLHGNAFARIERVGGRVVSLLPLMAEQMRVETDSTGSLLYLYEHDGGVAALAPESVWHIKLLGNGLVGLSPLAHARNAISIASASEGRISTIVRNAHRPAGVLTIEATLTPKQREQARALYKSLAEGGDDLHVLEAGMKYQQLGMSPRDVQLLEQRRFSVEDIARFFGVPSVLINDTAGSTSWGSGIQQLVQGFYKLNLRPYFERIEASILAHLFSPAERASYEPEFDLNALLLADESARVLARKEAIFSGQMTPNEARRLEGREPLAGGDELLMQAQMTPISLLGKLHTPAPAAPTPTPTPTFSE